MDVEVADSMKDTIAFLVARYKDDEAAGKVLLGIGDGPPTEEEAKAVAEKLVSMLLLMTDFAISQISLLGEIVGVSTDKMLATLGIQMAKMVDTL